MNELTWLTCTDPERMLSFLKASTDGFRVVHDNAPRDRKLRLFACACCRQVWHLLTDRRSRQAVEVAEKFADGRATETVLRAAWSAARSAAGSATGSATWSAARGATWSAALSAVRSATWSAAWSAARNATWSVQAALLRDIAGNPWRLVELRPKVPDSNGNLVEWPEIWLTPTVLALARAAYEERPGQACEACLDWRVAYQPCRPEGRMVRRARGQKCRICHGTGRIQDGSLDPQRLAVLHDALIDAGCPEHLVCPECKNESGYRVYCDYCAGFRHPGEKSGVCGMIRNPILAHLREPGPHVRGCWAIDCLSGKE